MRTWSGKSSAPGRRVPGRPNYPAERPRPEKEAPGLVAAKPGEDEGGRPITHAPKIPQIQTGPEAPGIGTLRSQVAERELRVDNGTMASSARLVGFNHVALEVGDIEEALEFYGRLFEIKLRGRGPGMAFVDAGDQFLALSEGRTQSSNDQRHVGLVVDDKRAVRRALKELGAEVLPGRGLDFLDPWGNRWQVVEYSEIQFTKAQHIMRGMGLGDLRKTENAL